MLIKFETMCYLYRLTKKIGKQIMENLPQDRLKEEPPFIYCGVDTFGPFEIKERRNTLKQYGVFLHAWQVVLFTLR